MTPDPADCTSAHFSFPLIYVSYVATLAQVQAEGELDLREETVRLLLGGATFEAGAMEAVKPLRQSQAASVKRGPRPLKRAIAVITKLYGPLTLDRLLEVFEAEDGERMNDLYRSASSPIDITTVEVNRDAGVVLYNTRRQSPTEPTKRVSFKRLKEILAGR
jgi:hypothetical protein